jgi:Mor family transcriptional regulator
LFGVTTEDVGGGITKLVTPQQPAFVKEANGWAFVSPMQEMLAGLPDDPTEVLSTLSKEYDLGARVQVQNIPEAYRQMAMQQLDQGMQAGLKKLPDESDEQFEARKEMTSLQLEQLKQLISDIDELTIGLALDGAQQRAFLDFIYTAVPESKLASQIAMYADSKTNFAGFFQPDAAMMMSFATKMGEADIAQVDQMFGAIRQQVKAAIDKDADLPSDEARAQMQSALDDFLAAFQATLKTGMMDGGAVLNLAPNSLTFVAGAFIGEPAKVETGLKKMAEIIKQKDTNSPEVKWNAASHGDVSFHTLSLPIPENEEQPRQLFGETVDLAIGIGKQSVYFAAGRDCLNAVKGVIDASGAEPQKSVPPMEMTFALKQIMEMAASIAKDNEKPMLQSIAAMLANEAAGRDHVRIVMQVIPGGIRTRIEAEEGVLRAIGMGAMQAQMQAAGAGQGP